MHHGPGSETYFYPMLSYLSTVGIKFLTYFLTHLFKGLWHAAIHEPLAVLISISETWPTEMWWIHISIPNLNLEKTFGCHACSHVFTTTTTCEKQPDPSHPHEETDLVWIFNKQALTVPSQAGGGDETLAQGLLSLVRDGPVVSEDSALQLVQVGGGELHAAPWAVPVFIIASLQQAEVINVLPAVRHRVTSSHSALLAVLHPVTVLCVRLG